MISKSVMFVVALSIASTAAFARDRTWSLEPLKLPFPCDAVQATPNGFTTKVPIEITCHGKRAISMGPRNSFEGASFACAPSGGLLMYGSLDLADKESPGKHFVAVIQKSCEE